MYQLVVIHHQKDSDKLLLEDISTDDQLKTVEEFVNDLTKITNEITREGYTFYSPPSSS